MIDTHEANKQDKTYKTIMMHTKTEGFELKWQKIGKFQCEHSQFIFSQKITIKLI